jgi:adenine deaminase
MGAYTDHESVEHHDALAKARLGMRVLMRNGSMEHNITELARILTEHNIDVRMTAFSTDVASAEKLASSGATDEHIRLAVAHGVPPIRAIQMATINAAEIFNVQQDVGSIAPGRFADVLIVRNLVSFDIDSVVVGGELVMKDGDFLMQRTPTRYPKSFYETVKLPKRLDADDLTVKAAGHAEVEVRVLGVVDGQIFTAERHVHLKPASGRLQADVEADVLLLAMVDRHQKGTGIGLGFVQGFGLKAGAIASSVSTETANLCGVGASPEDLAFAMNHIVDIGGGMVVVKDGRLLAVIELPILGLISEDPLNVATDKFSRAIAAAADLGCVISSPFSQLEFCFAGGLDGELKLSDEGLLQIKGGTVKRVSVIV